MTVKELKQYRLICAELRQTTDKRRLKELWEEKLQYDKLVCSISPEHRHIKRAIELYCFTPIGDGEASTWEDAAAKVGCGYSGESLRKAVERYLKKIS